MAIYSRYKLKTGEEVDYFPPIQNTDSPYATEAAMHADQANQLEGYGYLVEGAGAFTYLGTLAGTAADYEGFGVGLDLRASNLAADLNEAERDVIKTKFRLWDGVELIIESNVNGTVPFVDGDFAIGNISSYYTQTFSLKGTSALTYTIKAVSGFSSKVLKFTNTSTQTLTLNSINANTELWEKGVLSNSLSILSGESLEMFNDGFKWRVRNRY